ncbi:MAG: acyl-CoA dehydrogenase family protein [Anaerolineae bacterium]|nr:acyl-CoA dehydrogenase family protein [Anaerolineae bacterium]
MPENFFADNADLQFRLAQLDLRGAVGMLEDGYRYHDTYPAAPRNYRDAMDSYRLQLEVLGEICGEYVAPRAAEADEEGAHFEDGCVTYAAATQEAMALLRQAELMGPMIPWQYGGLNVPETIFQMMVEIVSRAEAGLMNLFGLQEISATVAEFGDEALKQRLLPRFASGEVTGAMALTEPDAGSDLGVVQTRATLDEETGTWRLTGVKRFITNGCADVLLVLARSEEDTTDARGLSLYAVEADETVRVRRIEHKLGIHTSPTCELQFNNTPAYLVGRRRFGLIRYGMAMMNGARLAIAAQALGIAEAAYREAYKYAEKRIQFGQPILQIPAVYRMLLSMRGEIEATRALLAEGSQWVDLKKAYERRQETGTLTSEERNRLRQADRIAGVLIPLGKYYATEMGNRVCDQAIQIHGGTGYMREFSVERHYRDVRITNIYEGTSQLQIVAALGGILGHTLDSLFDDWASVDPGEELAPLKHQLEQTTDEFITCIDLLKEQKDREVIDYYSQDLADMAVHVVNSWLMLRDAPLSEHKREMARFYISETLPKMRGSATSLRAMDPDLLKAREAALAL